MKTPGLGSKRLCLGPLSVPKNDWLELFPERLCMMLPSHSEVSKCMLATSMYTNNSIIVYSELLTLGVWLNKYVEGRQVK